MSTNDTSLTLSPAVTSGSRLAQLGLAAVLGLFVVGFAGFSHISAVHNAAHDVRHSLAFPCH
ncbi:MAG: CbtB-domain containing protein [Microvirga sp.]